MNRNSKSIAKYVLYWVLGFAIFLAIQFLFFDTQVSNPFTTLTESYNIGESLSEADALNVINTEGVVSIVEDNGSYILKTESGAYYQTPVTESVTLGLKLEGVKFEVVEEKEGIPFFAVLIGALVFTFIVRFAMDMYLKYQMSNTFSEAITAMRGDVNEIKFNPTSGKKDENKDETPPGKKITFADVQGIDELKPDLYRLVDCLKNPKKYEELGARMPKGMVLYGPPGTGKTLIAKAIAGTAGVPFISASGSDFIEMYVGVGAQRIRSLYKEARAKAPCIVFIDEIDAIGGKRGMAQNSERDQTINALLTELDGFAGSEGILTICATNRLDMLDSALIRPGRFDKQLAVPLPDRAGRFAILTKHARNKRLAEDVDLTRLAEKTVDFSGAELEALLNESALIAISRKSKFITNDDIEEAFFRMLMKGNKRKGIRNEEENRLVAYHEAGHALATKLLTEDEIASVTIVGSTSGAGGVTIRTPKETVVQSKKYLRNLIKVMYAGRAAEYILLQDDDEITTGASADIEQATNLIKNYIGTYGMGENGMLALRAFENTDKEILKEAATMANTLYQETIDLLHKNSDKLDAIANELIVNESIEGDMIDAIISGDYDQLMMDENI